jgi:hypothetical protein
MPRSLPPVVCGQALGLSWEYTDGHDLGQLFLVARCVKSTVEGRPLDFAANAPLQFGHCRYDRVLIQNAVAEHPVMADEAHGIFDHQHAVSPHPASQS